MQSSIIPNSAAFTGRGMMATKKSVHTLGEADLRGKKVLVRTNLDVPLDSRSHQITDDHRIVASVETIKFFQEKGARVILASHLGHPKGVNPHYSLKHLVPRLSEILQVHVEMANDCIGAEVTEQVRALSEGGVLLLENVRFYKEEERNSDILADKLASLADIYVNDDFGTAHKAHASTEGVAKVFKREVKPAIVGLHMQQELGSLGYLGGAVDNRPLAAIVGGSESNIGIIEPLLAKVDILILGGEMIYTFYKAQKYSVGKSTVQEDKLELAASLIEKAKANAVSFLLPTDILVAKKLEANAKIKTVPATAIPDNWKGVDVGPNSITTFIEALDNAQTVIWDGVMGVSEFVTIGGTDNDKKIAEKLAELKTEKGVTVNIGGGSAAAVNKAGLGDKMSYISTGGGAIWEILGGKTLPGVIGLDDA